MPRSATARRVGTPGASSCRRSGDSRRVRRHGRRPGATGAGALFERHAPPYSFGPPSPHRRVNAPGRSPPMGRMLAPLLLALTRVSPESSAVPVLFLLALGLWLFRSAVAIRLPRHSEWRSVYNAAGLASQASPPRRHHRAPGRGVPTARASGAAGIGTSAAASTGNCRIRERPAGRPMGVDLRYGGRAAEAQRRACVR